MNLNQNPLKPLRYVRKEVIPLLLLIRQWSKGGQSALIRTNEILFLLESLHLLFAKSKQEFTLESLIQQVEKVFNATAKNTFMENLQRVSLNSFHLHNLFKDLAQLIEKPNEDGSSRSIINIKGVLGIFVKNCCHEFQKLTFSQVTALHRQWKEFIDNSTDSHVINIKKLSEKEKLSKAKKERDFTLSLNLLLYSDGNSNVSVELKALHLAMLQAHFDHIEESSQSLQEAIRLAHLSQHEVVLEHALALLKRVQPTSLDVGRTLMKQFIKNARYQHKDLLISTGKLQLLHLDILCGQEPKHVLSSVMSSQFHVFNSIDDESTHKIAIRSSSLLLHGTALSQYNLNPLSDMVLQLLCHMISEGSNYNVHSISDLSKAIKLFAKSLHEKGHLTLGIKLLESAIKRLSIYDTTGRVIQPLKCGLAELLVEEGLQANDWAKVERNVTRMMTHNKVLGSYWKANLLYHKCQYSLAIDEANLLLTKLKYMM
jgi:hypothetical protein